MATLEILEKLSVIQKLSQELKENLEELKKLTKKAKEEDISSLLAVEDLNDFQFLKPLKQAQESAKQRVRELFTEA